MVVLILFLLLSGKFPKVSKQLLVNNNIKRPNPANQKTQLFGEGKKQIANAGKSNQHSSSLASLRKDVFETCTLTGSELSSFLGGGFAQSLTQIVCIRVWTDSKSNLVALGHIIRGERITSG